MLPPYLLRQEACISPFKGSGAYGPMYGDPIQAKCRLQSSRAIVRDAEGTDIVAKAKAFLNYCSSIPLDSKFTCEGITYRVIKCDPVYGINMKPNHLEVVLG